MSFATEFRDLMTDTVTHYALSSRDAYGTPSYGAGTSYPARVVRKHKLVRDAAGQQVVSTAQAWLGGTPAITPQDKVTLSDNSSPPIVAIERYQDEVGASHTVVFFL